ncbi:MAG: glycosyltransferase family 4 protein [Acidobacteria bacterium]|nr:glycosyltransferase family 4 protein [Acidobacteriota bacterium]
MTPIALNARFHAHRPTGMQRYALELARRLGDRIQTVRPSQALRGAAGHLWEQLYLPAAVRGKLLWSPNNTGPVAVSRQVCTIHDLIPLDRPEWFSRRFAAWYAWLLPRLARQVRHIITVSQFTKRRIVERLGVEPEKITVIPNGVDARFCPKPPEEIQAARRSLGIESAEYLLCVGSLEPRKNLGRLLRAWASVQESLPREIELVVAGGTGSSLVFESVSFDSLPPRVHFTGYVSEEQLASLYTGALALIYPSLYEGFGLPPLEAMACGTPVVTSHGTSLPEVAGDAVVPVDPEDVESIAEGILSVASSEELRRTLRQRGFQRIRGLTWERAAQQTWQLLLEQARA